MAKYAKNPEIAKNYRERLLCIAELQALIGIKPTLVIGGEPAASALNAIPHDTVLPHCGSTVWRLSALSVYAVLSNHLSSGLMSGQNAEQASLLRKSMLLVCAVQKTVSAGDSIDNYVQYQSQIGKERETEVAANYKWIEGTFGAGSVAKVKTGINSILHHDFQYLKSFHLLLQSHTQDKSVLLDMCFRCIILKPHFIGMESILSMKYSFKQCKKLWTCGGFRKLLRVSPINALNTLTKLKEELGGVENAVKVFSTGSFCANIDKLIDHFATLKKELEGVENAVKVLSTDSFCAKIDKLLRHLPTLKKELEGVEPVVRLLSTDSFCASIDKLLPHLASIRKEFEAEEAVKLFFSDSFCKHITTLTPRLPALKDILGFDGILVIFSNNNIPSMNDQQWDDFMKFIAVAEKGHVKTFTQRQGCVSICKRHGWSTALEVYQLPSTPKTQRGFPKAIKDFVRSRSIGESGVDLDLGLGGGGLGGVGDEM